MISLHLRGVSFAPSAARTALDAVTLDMVAPPAGQDRRFVGVVGANGAGKSTLLAVLAGHREPTSGVVEVEAAAPPRLVHQDVERCTHDIVAFATQWDGTAERLRRRLDLDPDDVADTGRGWSTLSPGIRKRWQLAAALADEPDVLLLDEPTNHLDRDARALVVAALADFRGLGLIVSHDRHVLETLMSVTLRVHAGGVTAHAGSYLAASARWRTAEAAERDAHDRARREANRQRRILADVRCDRHSAESGARRQRRLAGASDPDAREAGRKFAQRKAEAALAQRVGQMHARLERTERTASTIQPPRDHAGALGFHATSTRRRVLAAVQGDVAHAGGGVLLRDVDVAIERGARIRIDGRNGAGKTTLLAALIDQLTRTGERVGLLPQLALNAGIVRELAALDPAQRGRVLGTVARLGVDPDRLLRTDEPSSGEIRKVALAHLLAGDASVLLLDEPTNHLDLPSIEHLEAALDDWPGALVLITHDELLADAVTDTTWTVANGMVTVGTDAR